MTSGSGNATVFNGNGTSHGANATATTATFPPFTPTPSPATASSSPRSSKLGAGLGAALGFAAVVILLVLWHIFKAQRQGRQRRWLEEEYAARRGDGGSSDSQHQDSAGVLPPSVRSSEKDKQNETVVTTTLLTSESEEPELRENPADSQAEVSSPRRERGRGRGGRPLGSSRWERRDGHGRADSSSTQTMTPASGERPKFSFEGVVQSEDSIERLSQQRIATPADGFNKDGKDVDHDLDKGERARHVYEMEPY